MHVDCLSRKTLWTGDNFLRCGVTEFGEAVAEGLLTRRIRIKLRPSPNRFQAFSCVRVRVHIKRGQARDFACDAGAAL